MHCIHKDHRHPLGELNFILALTDMFSSIVWRESAPGKSDFLPSNWMLTTWSSGMGIPVFMGTKLTHQSNLL